MATLFDEEGVGNENSWAVDILQGVGSEKVGGLYEHHELAACTVDTGR